MDVVAPRSEDRKLIVRTITFKLVQPICPAYINVTDGQTDGQTNGRTIYDSSTALALGASRGNNNKTRKRAVDYIPLQIGDPIPWRHLASDV